MCPTSTALGALRVAAIGGPALVPAAPGGELTRALDVASRVMAAANDRMAAALADHDLAGYERAGMSYDAAERRYDEMCAAASEAGYLLGFASVPDKPAKLVRFTRRERMARRIVARLRRPLGAAAAH
jgi:hypothetical protein